MHTVLEPALIMHAQPVLPSVRCPDEAKTIQRTYQASLFFSSPEKSSRVENTMLEYSPNIVMTFQEPYPRLIIHSSH